MKKFLYSFFLLLIFLSASIVTYLSIFGLETSKFNNLIVKEIKKKNPEIELKLEKVKIKLDIKKIHLFISTNYPELVYQNIKIPITEIKIYTKINKIFKSKIEISQIIFGLEKFKTNEIQKIAIRIKPSNFKTYLLNNVKNGEIEKAIFDLNIDKDFKLIDYIASGSIKKIDAKVARDLVIKDVSFNFIIENKLALINSIKGSYAGVTVSNGFIDIKKEKEIKIKGKFKSDFSLKEDQLNTLFTNVKFLKDNKIEMQGSLLHNFDLKINNNFKIIDYNYKSSGEIAQAQVNLKNGYKNNFIEKKIKKIFFKKNKLEIIFNQQNKNLLLFDGLYSFNESNYKIIKVKYNLEKKSQNYLIDLNLTENIFLDLINYGTNVKKNSNIKFDLRLENKKFIFKTINFTEDKNTISIKNLVINKKKEIEELSNIQILTFRKNKENNNFKINIGKKISITGKKYDSSNLLKIITGPNKSNLLKNFSKEVDIKIKNLITKSNVPLNNFNLIGLVEKGKFNKISAKSEFSENEYLDVTLKKDLNNKKIIEIYSDYPQALLSDYKFFEGIKGGKLLYSSVIDETSSVSKLKIENFKITEAPAFATLLTLADLGGIADLLSGKGMSFDILEIDLKDDTNVTTIEEILALGSSVSLHANGYVEKKTGLVSLSGSLVPAKMLNSFISKIPLVGKILIGDKVGEGVFGVSFKIKGLPGKIKTTVNPLKTITPRFITRAIEKMKKN